MPTIFFAQLNGGNYIKVPATRMELKDNVIIAWYDNDLAAVVDISCVLFAHICYDGKNHD